MNSRLTVAAGVATVLASTALYPLIRTGTWFWGGVGAVIVVAFIGAATRRRAVPAAVCFLAAIAGEFLYLNAVFAHGQSWLGVVPTEASLRHLGFLVMQATTGIPGATPPVAPRPGIVLAAVAGIGLVGALTDLLAVRLHRAAIAGLPLLVLFCVPLTTDTKPGAVGATLVFCAGVAGYLGLLSADGRYRLRLWGRVVHPWEEDQVPDTRPLAAAGRRVGFAAVVLALFVPLLMPALRAHQFFAGSGGGGGGTQGAQGGVSFPRPLDLLTADLQNRHPQVVLNYRVSGLGTPPYLQLYVLGDLTTRAWTMARPTGARTLGTGGTMPTAPGVTASTPGLDVNEVISLASSLVASGGTSYLPVPYPPLRVDVGGTWRVDPGSLTMHSTDVRLAGLQYDVTGKDVNPSPQQLSHAGPPPASMAAYTKVPAAFGQLKSLAESITAGQTSAYGRAVALQAWFHRPGLFTYSLTTHLGTGAAALVQFLTKSKAGACQQFAFGMAVLARQLGIPSRVVIGFTQGTFAGHGTWRVMTTDAHAWPELYFSGFGWLAFEPTPTNFNGPAGQGTATVPPYSEASPRGAPAPQTGQTPTGPTPSASAVPSGARPPQKPTDPQGPSSGAATSQPGNPAPFVALAIALLTVLLLTPGLSRVIVRRWRWRTAHDDVTRAHVAWRELRDELADHRIAWQASESPRALAGRLAGLLSLTGAEREALERVARAEERASYAVRPADSAPLQSDITLVRRAVIHTASRSARWTARIAPPSVLAPAFAGVRHALDVFGWMELATTRARAHSPFRRRAPHPHIT